MLRPIWKSRSLAKRVFRSVLVPVLTVSLLGWFGLGFSLQASLCAHGVDKATMHGGGLCAWLCAVYGQDLSVRSPEWPSVQAPVEFIPDRTASGLCASFLDAFDSRGPPRAVLGATLSA